jgi:hypothetical protein
MDKELVVGSLRFKELDDKFFNLPIQEAKERRKEYNKMYYQTKIKPVKLQKKEEDRLLFEKHIDILNNHIVNNILNII